MSTPTRSKGSARRSGPAASLLADAKPEPKVIEGELEQPAEDTDATSPAPDPGNPIATATLEEHQRLQREHREWLAKMASQSPGEAAESDQGEHEDPADVIALPTPEEIAQRKAEEALGAYLAALIEMPDNEPIYVVGVRPPRPQFAGLKLELGDVVPGAVHWPRLDSWVRAGVVVPQQATKANSTPAPAPATEVAV